MLALAKMLISIHLLGFQQSPLHYDISEMYIPLTHTYRERDRCFINLYLIDRKGRSFSRDRQCNWLTRGLTHHYSGPLHVFLFLLLCCFCFMFFQMLNNWSPAIFMKAEISTSICIPCISALWMLFHKTKETKGKRHPTDLLQFPISIYTCVSFLYISCSYTSRAIP